MEHDDAFLKLIHSPIGTKQFVEWSGMETHFGKQRPDGDAVFFFALPSNNKFAIHYKPNEYGVDMTKLSYADAGKLITEETTVMGGN